MKIYTRTLHSFTLALAFVLGIASASLQAQNTGPAPTTLPGATTEIYKTIDDVSLPIHIYTPDGKASARPRPAIIFFFGGGWRGGTPAQFENQCKYLASRGMVAMTAEYRVSSRHGTTAASCLRDAKTAMRWTRTNAKRLGIDPNRLAAGGGSAGGHLAAALGTIIAFEEPYEDLSFSSVPNALALFNPALILAPIEDKFPIDAEKIADLSKRMGAPLEALSPYHHIRENRPPTLIIHGKADKTVPFMTAELFTKEMKKHGNRCELVGYENQGHGFFNYGKGDNSMFRATVTEMDAFLKSLGYLKGKPTIDSFMASLN